MKKQVLFVIALCVSHTIIFFGGIVLGKQRASHEILAATQLTDAEVILGHYSIYRDISAEIGSAKFDKAKCNADLGASAMFDGVKGCLSDANCRAGLQQMALTIAPEILGDGTIPFDYVSTKNGRKECVQ